MSSVKWSNPANLLGLKVKIFWHAHICFLEPILQSKKLFVKCAGIGKLNKWLFLIVKWTLKGVYGNGGEFLPWDLGGALGRSISHYLELKPNTLPVDGGLEHLIKALDNLYLKYRG